MADKVTYDRAKASKELIEEAVELLVLFGDTPQKGLKDFWKSLKTSPLRALLAIDKILIPFLNPKPSVLGKSAPLIMLALALFLNKNVLKALWNGYPDAKTPTASTRVQGAPPPLSTEKPTKNAPPTDHDWLIDQWLDWYFGPSSPTKQTPPPPSTPHKGSTPFLLGSLLSTDTIQHPFMDQALPEAGDDNFSYVLTRHEKPTPVAIGHSAPNEGYTAIQEWGDCHSTSSVDLLNCSSKMHGHSVGLVD